MLKTKLKAKKSVGKAKPEKARNDAGEESRSDLGLLPRGFAIVEAVIREERPLSAAEIGESIGLKTSTTHRLLQTLTQIGYISRDASKRYFPTARALFPISLYHPLNGLRRAASEELRNIRELFGMTTALQIFLGSQRIVLEIVLANEAFSPYFQTEVTAPSYATASGKILLSTFDPARRREMLGPEPYVSHASGTLLTAADLERELLLITERGYSVTQDEMLEGLSGVAVPIVISSGQTVGAIVVSGSTRNFDAETVKKISIVLKRSAERFAFASPDMRAVSRFLGL